MKKSEDYLKTDFVPEKCLPLDLTIDKSGTQLYRIGLSLWPVEGVSRPKSRYPPLLFFIELYYHFRSVVVLLLPDQSLDFYRLIGDFGFVFGTKAHFALTCIFSILLALNSHLLNFYIFVKKLEPTYFQLFSMMAGVVSPQSIGLTDKATVLQLLRRARVVFAIGEYVPFTLGFSIVLINLFSFYSNSTLVQIVVYVVPNSLGWFVVVNIVYSVILWQLIYFYLITFYLKSKLKAVNQTLRGFTKSQVKRPISFSKVCADLSAIYTEIHEYDNIYWSKFLAFVWMSCATILSTLSFFIIFGEMLLIIRIFCLYFDLFFVAMLILVVSNCATVYLEVNKSYKELNSFMTLWNRRSISKGLKVWGHLGQQ